MSPDFQQRENKHYQHGSHSFAFSLNNQWKSFVSWTVIFCHRLTYSLAFCLGYHITCLLLCHTSPLNSVAWTAKILIAVSVAQEPGSAFNRELKPLSSYWAVALQDIVWSFNWGCGSCFQEPGLLTWIIQEASVPGFMGPSKGLLECFQDQAADPLKSKGSEREQTQNVLHNPVSEITQRNFHHILFIRRKSVRAAPPEGETISLHPLRRRGSKNLWTPFKAITGTIFVKLSLKSNYTQSCTFSSILKHLPSSLVVKLPPTAHISSLSFSKCHTYLVSCLFTKRCASFSNFLISDHVFLFSPSLWLFLNEWHFSFLFSHFGTTDYEELSVRISHSFSPSPFLGSRFPSGTGKQWLD